MADWYGKKTWSRFGTSTWLIQQNSPCEQLAIQKKFWRLKRRGCFYSLIFCTIVQLSISVSFWGPKASHLGGVIKSSSPSHGKRLKMKCSELVQTRSTRKSSSIRSQRRKRHSNPFPYGGDIAVWICPITFNLETNFFNILDGINLYFY